MSVNDPMCAQVTAKAKGSTVAVEPSFTSGRLRWRTATSPGRPVRVLADASGGTVGICRPLPAYSGAPGASADGCVYAVRGRGIPGSFFSS